MHTHAVVPMCRPEGSFMELVLPFHLSVGSRAGRKVARPAWQAPSPPEPSHWLPHFFFKNKLIIIRTREMA